MPKTGKWGVFNREPLPNHGLPEKGFKLKQRYQIEILQIFIKGFNMCCMIIEKTIVIENGLPEVQMAFRKALGHIIIKASATSTQGSAACTLSSASSNMDSSASVQGAAIH